MAASPSDRFRLLCTPAIGSGCIACENEVRTAGSPLARTEMMRRHLALGKGEDQIAVIYNCSVATVRNTLALLDSPKVVQDAIETGQITLTHAKALAKLNPEEQRAKVAELVAAGKDATPHQRSRQQAAVVGERPASNLASRSRLPW